MLIHAAPCPTTSPRAGHPRPCQRREKDDAPLAANAASTKARTSAVTSDAVTSLAQLLTACQGRCASAEPVNAVRLLPGTGVRLPAAAPAPRGLRQMGAEHVQVEPAPQGRLFKAAAALQKVQRAPAVRSATLPSRVLQLAESGRSLNETSQLVVPVGVRGRTRWPPAQRDRLPS